MVKDGGAANQIIMASILFLLGAILIGIVAGQINGPVNKVVYYSEAVDFTTARAGCSACSDGSSGINGTFNYTLVNAPSQKSEWAWKAAESDCDITGLNVTNGTTSWTSATDYVLTTNGKIAIKNTTVTIATNTNKTYVTYRTCPNDYMTSNWSRSVMNMIGGFMAICLLAAGAGIVINLLRNRE